MPVYSLYAAQSVGTCRERSHVTSSRVLPEFRILEIMYRGVTWRKEITNEQFVYEGGGIQIPDAPGLGIELNEVECLKHPYQVHTLRHYTGALTDIRPAQTEFYF